MMEDEVYTYMLPSPTDTAYRTPSSTHSLRSQPFDDMSPSSTPPLPSDPGMKRRSNDSADQNDSDLDLRSMTPTLHASLVSEILSLRRDLENKTQDIDRLEETLHQTQNQNETLNNNLTASSKETRSLKRQMQLLEGGTVSALNELTKERDEAHNDTADLRRRLEQSQKRAKSQEEHAETTLSLWEKDKEAWTAEKRVLETKAHIAEGRLKVVLSEITNAQHNGHLTLRQVSPERNCQSRTSLLESPSRSSVNNGRGRRYSTTSINSDHGGGRYSVASFANGGTINLADELAFDEQEEDRFIGEHVETGRLSPDALPEESVRPTSSLSVKARKILGVALNFDTMDKKEDTDPMKAISVELLGHKSSHYVDSAIQFSPPTSPRLRFENEQRRQGRPTDLQFNQHSVISVGAVSPTDSIESRHAPWNKPLPVMVSSSCQTVNAVPSPPLTPAKTDIMLATIHETAVEGVVMITSGTQTEPSEIPHQPVPWRANAESYDLTIPTINIIPPGSRPVTPTTSIVLPPRTKNASNQVDLSILGTYTSKAMQTEDIRIDKRSIFSSIQNNTMPQSQARTITTSRAMPQMLRRKTSPGMSMFDSQRPNAGLSRNPPSQDIIPLTRDFASKPLPLRQNSDNILFENDLQDEYQTEDTFEEDDIFGRPTAKFTLNRGKMVSQEALEDIDEIRAAAAGEAAAIEHLKNCEGVFPPEIRSMLAAQGRLSPRKMAGRAVPSAKPLRRIPSLRSNDMRRTALISSGAAAHRASNSQSTNASHESSNPPPFAIPLRYSSARVTKSMSEGGGRSSRASSAASPTKNKHSRRHILRKSRSGPALSPHGLPLRKGSRSPEKDTRVSIVPEMPTFQMPAVQQPAFLSQPYAPSEASAPRPSIAMGPSRRQNHMKTHSDAVSMHQTSVVDSIAQTMVGEWMYKYVRRRKSFGVPERSRDFDPTKTVDELSANAADGGVRHKRWVWLAPYERAVMWSSKQPTSGTALMGKSGRKLVIKSVLDVRDDNPMPKGSGSGPHFNRSILILTPQRALKFTAVTQERHFVWLTALSFLSHSPLSINDVNNMPPPPPPPDDQILAAHGAPSVASSIRKRPIRDSIRVAKDGRSFAPSIHSVNVEGPVADHFGGPATRDYYDPIQDSAVPPTIKRFHARHRSNTAPRLPPTSFRGASARDVAPSLPAAGSYSFHISGQGSDRGQYTPSLGMQSVVSSRRGSEASTAGRPIPQHMFADFSQTVRMDAFMEEGKQLPPPPPPPPPKYNVLRTGHLKKKDMGYWGIEDGRGSVSPAESMLQREIRESNMARRVSIESRDSYREY